MPAPRPIARRLAALGPALLIAAPGASLLAFAWRLDQPSFERHLVLPWYFVDLPSRPGPLRACIFLVAFVLLALARAVARWSARVGAREAWAAALRVSLGILLAGVVSEAIVRRGLLSIRRRRIEWVTGTAHPRYGWVLTPGRTTRLFERGRGLSIEYAIDAHGDRSMSAETKEDPTLPTVIVTGESIAVGHGLAYEESIPALLSRELSLQVVGVGAGGYGADQAALRAEDALARLRQPVAVVAFFLPVMLSRALQDFRPRLMLSGSTLELEDAASGPLRGWALRDLVVNELPWLSDARLEKSLRLCAAIEAELARKARAHGAAPLFVVPSFGPPRPLQAHPEAFIVRAVLGEQKLPFLVADWDSAIPFDGHPDRVGAGQIAGAISAALAPALRAARKGLLRGVSR